MCEKALFWAFLFAKRGQTCYNCRMLILAFPKLKGTLFAEASERFFRSPLYVILVAVLMAVSELFALELPVYYAYLFLLLYGILFTEDTLCAVPIACCAYMTLSPFNNPAKYPTTNVFNDPDFVAQFCIILIAACVLLVAKTVIVLFERRGSGFFPELLSGFLILGISYMLGGIFTEHDALKDVVFGLAQLASLCVLYLLFILSVDWRRIRKSYFPILFTAIGIAMCVEIAGMYTLPGVFQNGNVLREKLFTGWGIYNNVACMMAMCIPAPCYLAATRKVGWGYALLAGVFYVFLLLTQSRGGILFGTVVFVLCVLYVIICCKPAARPGVLAVTICALVVVLILTAVFHKQIAALFDSLIRVGTDPNYRDKIYGRCWDAFLGAPWFGVGFYDTPGVTFDIFAHFMPPRAHNTYLQILTSCGLFGMAAYLFHRLQTLSLFFGHPTHEKTFVALSVLALLLTSIVDCNFFNFGPVMIYGMLFALAEGFEHVRRGRRLYVSLMTPVR